MTRRKAPAEGQPDAELEIVPMPEPSPEAASDKPRRRRKRRSAAVATNEVDAVRVADKALATVIGLAAHEVPGVVGMAPAGLTEGLRRILGVSQVDEGVEVEHAAVADTGGPVTRVVLHVVVAYGVNIPAVAESVVERVRYAASAFAGVELADVKVHVAGVSRG
jgi:uncharacterized alkaline shock family protein YloU